MEGNTYYGDFDVEMWMRNQSSKQSTQSLPALLRGKNNENHIKRFQSLSTLAYKPQYPHVFSQSESQSIENVCDFINNNNQPNILELPGLKVKSKNVNQTKKEVKVDLREGKSLGQSVKIALMNGDMLDINLVAKEETINKLLEISLEKSKVDTVHRSMFCLAKKYGVEYFYLTNTDKVSDHAEHGVQTFHMRLLAPPTSDLRKKFLHDKFDINNCGNFSYKGRVNKREESNPVHIVINNNGIEINSEHILWRNVSQVSYSQTFLQLLYFKNQKITKNKICFPSQNIKLIHDLIMTFIDKSKTKHSSKKTEIKATESCKFEALCQRICSATKEAVRSLSTPRRKRSKSIGANSLQRPMKSILNRSRSSADASKVKRNIMFDMQEPITQDTVNTSIKRKSETQLENLPKRSKIRTNPKNFNGYQKPVHNLQSVRTPVRMGTRTFKESTIKPSEKKIVCVSLSRNDIMDNALVLSKTEEGVFIDNIKNGINSKLVKGDRIVAVNGWSLEGCSLEKANIVLASSGNLVNIILSRS